MKKTLFLAAFLIALATLSFAQEDPAPAGQYPHYFGLGGGLTTGYGLSYRAWDGNFGVQITGLPVFQPDKQFVIAGVAGLWTIQDLQWTRFFAWAGGSGSYDRSLQDVYNPDETSTPTVVTTFKSAVGGGVGFEFIAFDHLAFDLMFGYQLNYDGSVGTGLTVESGLYYRL